MPGKPRIKRLLEPAQIAGMKLRNRVMLAPMGSSISTEGGGVSDRLIKYLARIAKGGCALLTTEAACVDAPQGLGEWIELRIDHDRFVNGHAMLTEQVHSYGAKIAVQLHHAGRSTNLHWTEGRQPVAPSAIPKYGMSWTAKELTRDEIHAIVEKYAQAAFRAQKAGYDAVNLHAAHGYLPHQFSSPKTNKRTDDYGGSLENRLRFSCEVVQKIKQYCGKDFPVIYRIAIEGGYDAEEGLRFLKPLEQAGVDAFDMETGGISPSTAADYNIAPMARAQGWIIPQTAPGHQRTSLPLIAVSEIKDPWFAEDLLRSGNFEFVMLGRALLADPDWVNKAAEGRFDDIAPCPSCDHCLGGWTRAVSTHVVGIRCAINAECGREVDFGDMTPAPVKKRVMVVGGGLAGMEAARVAALRGHRVSLYDKRPALGGVLEAASASPGKQNLLKFNTYLGNQIKKLGVKVVLGAEVNPAVVAKANPNAVIIATGARPVVPQIPGVKSKNVVQALDVLEGNAKLPSGKVVVLGGDETACEAAELLVNQGHSVTIAAPCTEKGLAFNATGNVRRALVSRLNNLKVPILAETEATSIDRGKVVLKSKDGKKQTVEAYTVVLALGMAPVDDLARKLAGVVPEVRIVGDSAGVKSIVDAVYEGHIAARRL